jgi:hypothetical protein
LLRALKLERGKTIFSFAARREISAADRDRDRKPATTCAWKKRHAAGPSHFQKDIEPSYLTNGFCPESGAPWHPTRGAKSEEALSAGNPALVYLQAVRYQLCNCVINKRY